MALFDKKEKEDKLKNPSKETKKKEKKKTPGMHIPKTIADSIPYVKVYEKGIIEIRPGEFSKSYRLESLNFKTLNDEDQWRKAKEYGNFLGMFEEDVKVEVTLYNKTVDIEEFQRSLLLEMQSDDLNGYREEFNEMLLDKMTGAKNNLTTDRILTIVVKADTIREAIQKFAQIDITVTESLSQITGKDAPALGTIERLEMLNNIYNQDIGTPLNFNMGTEKDPVDSFTLENCQRQGITTKDVIAPSDISPKRNYVRIGETFVRSFYIAYYPNWIKATTFTDLASIPCNMLVSAYFDAIPQGNAAKLLKRQNVNIVSEISDRGKNSGMTDLSMLSPTLKEDKDEVDKLRDMVSKEDSRLFTTCMIITLFAKDMESLENSQALLTAIGNRDFLTIKPLNNQQEQAFNSALPLGNNQIKIERLMTTESVSGLVPFDVLDVREDGGFYYGISPVSKNMVIYNRTNDMNPNGCILGMPGAGKSFRAKEEMLNVILNTDDEIYIIDPEREYTPLANALGGTVIKLESGSSLHINPFDLNLENTDDGADPVKVKSGFVETLCEIAIGGRYGLSPIEKTLISRCTMQVYDHYVHDLQERREKIDTKTAPTMKDFYEALLMQSEREATDIALALERYVSGADDLFSHRTNIDINNRFTIYDVKDLGSGLKELGLHIALDNIWNNMIENKAKGKRTWIYVDEFHFLMQKDTSAEYISQIWKRARKWNGIPTAITQNVEDMLKSENARAIINNSPFIILLAQSAMNKKHLSDLLNISPVEQKYISTNKPGMGLIRIGENIIPVDDSFPKDTMLYKVMTTKPDERM